MSQSVISDNWSLQNISEMLVNGLEKTNTHFINIDSIAGKYEFKEIPSAIVTIEAFFDFITDIILRDQILVEENFVNAWKNNGSALNKAAEAAVIRGYSFRNDFEKLVEPREEFIRRLCITEDLRQHHEENRLGWNNNKHTPHGYLSQTLWGGAGMLARSFVYERGYTPHPVRKRLFIDAGFAITTDNAVNNLNNIINEKRASIARVLHKGDELFSLSVNLLPIPIKVIQESNSVQDLITVALQLRAEYQELRNWLGCYQLAMSDGSYKDIAKFQKIIHSISLYVDSFMNNYDSNAPTFTAGIGVLKVAIKGQPINALKNQFGVRSMINNLIVSRSGNSDLKKFLGFFGHRDTKVGLQVLEHFSKSTFNKSNMGMQT